MKIFSNPTFSLAIFLLLLAPIFFAQAEDSKGLSASTFKTKKGKKSIGRLPDGRAFRVDKDGFQIVDHLAELEVTVDGLNRQVNSLESQLELGESNSAVPAAGNNLPGTSAADPLNEIDLVQPLQPTPSGVTDPKMQKQLEELRQLIEDPPAAPVRTDCSLEISSLKRKISALQHDLKGSRLAASAQLGNGQGEAALLEQVSRLQEALMENPSEEEVERKISTVQKQNDKTLSLLKKKNQHLVKLEQELEDRVSREEELSGQVGSLRKELLTLQESLTKYASQNVSGYRSPRGHLLGASKAFAEQGRQKRLKQATRGDRYDSRSVSSARGEFRDKLLKINSLKVERERVFRLAKNNKILSVRPRELRTTTHLTLDSLKSQVKRLDGGSKIKSIRRGLSEIEAIIRKDIALARKMQKL